MSSFFNRELIMEGRQAFIKQLLCIRQCVKCFLTLFHASLMVGDFSSLRPSFSVIHDRLL